MAEKVAQQPIELNKDTVRVQRRVKSGECEESPRKLTENDGWPMVPDHIKQKLVRLLKVTANQPLGPMAASQLRSEGPLPGCGRRSALVAVGPDLAGNPPSPRDRLGRRFRPVDVENLYNKPVGSNQTSDDPR